MGHLSPVDGCEGRLMTLQRPGEGIAAPVSRLCWKVVEALQCWEAPVGKCRWPLLRTCRSRPVSSHVSCCMADRFE